MKNAEDRNTQARGGRNFRLPYPDNLWIRAISLTLALSLATLTLVYPAAVAGTVGAQHWALFMLMLGIGAGFVHGVGFVPQALMWRALFHPFFGWLLMSGAMALLRFTH